MASTITWGQLRELAAFRATRGCAISLHLDLDPALAPTADDVQTRVTSLLHRAERRLEGIAPRLGHDARDGARADRLDAGRLVEIADRTEDVPGRHDQAAGLRRRYERHIEDIVGHHLKRVADTLDRCARTLRDARVVLVGTAETLAGFEEMLAHDTRAAVVGRTSVEAHAGAGKLLAAVRPILDAWWAGRESELIERWREEAARNGRAAAGWEATLEAASDGRVETLLVEAGVDRPAYECPRCGRAQLTDGICLIDGTRLESGDADIDVVVHRTLENGGTVRVIRERRDLDPVGGLGALLRF